jgi:hypothetical protein
MREHGLWHMLLPLVVDAPRTECNTPEFDAADGVGEMHVSEGDLPVIRHAQRKRDTVFCHYYLISFRNAMSKKRLGIAGKNFRVFVEHMLKGLQDLQPSIVTTETYT